MGHLNATMGLLQQTGALNDLGVGKLPLGTAMGEFSDSHPTVLNDDDHAAQVGKLVVAIIARRLPSMAYHMLGYPGAFAGLSDPVVGPLILERLKSDWESFEAMGEQSSAFWKRLRARPPFSTKRVQQAARLVCAMASGRGQLWGSTGIHMAPNGN